MPKVYTLFKFLYSLAAILTFTSANSQVNQQWLKTYDGDSSLDDAILGPHAMQVIENGNIYLTGYATTIKDSKTDYLIINYRPDGTLNWANSYTAYWHLELGK